MSTLEERYIGLGKMDIKPLALDKEARQKETEEALLQPLVGGTYFDRGNMAFDDLSNQYGIMTTVLVIFLFFVVIMSPIFFFDFKKHKKSK